MPSNNKERDLIDTVIITLQRGFKKKKNRAKQRPAERKKKIMR